MKIKGWDLNFFNSGEWQVCDERLKDLEKASHKIRTDLYDPGDGYNPGRSGLFKALRATPYRDVQVAIIGQDPYPDKRFATGLAFSIPDGFQQSEWPPTLTTLLKEYSTDLHRPIPSQGVLDRWAERGVLLWNAFPSCLPGKSLSHDWEEWTYLTREIVTKLSERGVVFALLGQVARSYSEYIPLSNNRVVCTSHPSLRASRASRSPFVGSRLFSTINANLNDIALKPIDWDLP